MGTPVGLDELVERWAEWELEYVKRGFRTISLDDFIKAGGYGASLQDKLGIKREPGEQVVPHSYIYMQRYPDPPPAVVDLERLMQPGAEAQMGTYTVPSTELQSDENRR